MPTSAGEWLREVDFWRQLSSKHKELYVDVIGAIPMDRAGGFRRMHKSLWLDCRHEKMLLTTFMMLKIVTNTWTTFANRPSWTDWFDGTEQVVFFQSTQANATMFRNEDGNAVVELCFQAWGDNLLNSYYCMSRVSWGLWRLFAITTFVEQIAMSCFAFAVIVSFFLFVVCAYDPVLLNFPSWFMRAPMTMATFSVLHLIHYANPIVMKRLPRQVTSEAINLFGARYIHCTGPCFRDFVAIVVSVSFGVCGLVLSVSGLLVNMFALSFITLIEPTDWGTQDIMHFVAFINRIAGIVDVDHMEVERLQLFRYGGADSKWKPRHVYRARAYFDLMLLKLTHGKFVRSRRERWHCWMCLATFKSEDLQRLWLDADAEKHRDDSTSLMQKVIQFNQLNDPFFWPPHGSDPNWRRKGLTGEGPLHDLSCADHGDDEVDLRMSYFLENTQSYRLWLEAGKVGEVLLHDSNGKLAYGGAEEVVQPRIEQLEEHIQALLQDPSTEHFDIACLLQVEIDDLKLIGTRSQNMKASHEASKKKTNDALVVLRSSQRGRGDTENGLEDMQITRHARLEDHLLKVQNKDVARSSQRAAASKALDLTGQRQRRAEALEVFMLLKSVDLTSTRNLKRAVGGTSAELSISDVRHVAEHRQATIQQLKEVLHQATVRSSDPEHQQEVVAAMGSLLHQIDCDISLFRLDAEMVAELRQQHKSLMKKVPSAAQMFAQFSMAVPQHARDQVLAQRETQLAPMREAQSETGLISIDSVAEIGLHPEVNRGSRERPRSFRTLPTKPPVSDKAYKSSP